MSLEATGADSDVLASALTSRQQEIVILICQGFTWKEIAQRTGLSHKTIETHKARIRRRTNMHDVASLVRWAIRQELIEA